jgi:hypothetical protein
MVRTYTHKPLSFKVPNIFRREELENSMPKAKQTKLRKEFRAEMIRRDLIDKVKSFSKPDKVKFIEEKCDKKGKEVEAQEDKIKKVADQITSSKEKVQKLDEEIK